MPNVQTSQDNTSESDTGAGGTGAGGTCAGGTGAGDTAPPPVDVKHDSRLFTPNTVVTLIPERGTTLN